MLELHPPTFDDSESSKARDASVDKQHREVRCEPYPRGTVCLSVIRCLHDFAHSLDGACNTSESSSSYATLYPGIPRNASPITDCFLNSRVRAFFMGAYSRYAISAFITLKKQTPCALGTVLDAGQSKPSIRADTSLQIRPTLNGLKSGWAIRSLVCNRTTELAAIFPFVATTPKAQRVRKRKTLTSQVETSRRCRRNNANTLHRRVT